MFTIKKHVWLTSLLLGMVAAAILVTPAQAGKSKETIELENQAKASLDKLYAKNAKARHLRTKAKAVLTFPTMIKIGIGDGLQVGTGVLADMKGRTLGYHNAIAGSFGHQAGIKGFHHSLFLMNNRAIDRLTKAKRWQLGVGPSLVIVKEGGATGFTTTTLDKDIYAFVYDSRGVFSGTGIEGMKITKIQPNKNIR